MSEPQETKTWAEVREYAEAHGWPDDGWVPVVRARKVWAERDRYRKALEQIAEDDPPSKYGMAPFGDIAREALGDADG